MAMTLDSILQHAYSRLNKEQSGGVYGLDQLNIDLPFFFYTFLNKRYGIPTNWLPGTKMPNFAFETTQLMTDDLSPLKVVMGGNGPDDPGVLSVNSNGIATLPTDYFHYSALNGFFAQPGCDDDKMPAVEVCTDQQFSEYLTHYSRNKNGAAEPYCNFQNGVIEFRPKDIGGARFAYLKTPPQPFYDYYIVVATATEVYIPPDTNFTATAANVYRTGAITGTFPSLSQELIVKEYLWGDFANAIVDLMSENLRSQFMKGMAAAREGKDA